MDQWHVYKKRRSGAHVESAFRTRYDTVHLCNMATRRRSNCVLQCNRIDEISATVSGYRGQVRCASVTYKERYTSKYVSYF